MAFKWLKRKETAKTENIEAETQIQEETITEEQLEKEEAPSIKTDIKEEIIEEIEESCKEEKEKKEEKVGFFKRLRKSMSGTRKHISGRIDPLFDGKTKIDDEILEELEELLITSDIGVETSMKLIEKISKNDSKIQDAESLKDALKKEIASLFDIEEQNSNDINVPHVIMVAGVNGVGKTTTIGKLAYKFEQGGKKTLIGAADTFRAAAVEQIDSWAQKAGSDIVKHKYGADPAAVAYDSVDAAIARKADIVLIDTAGRLHTKVNLMEELKKIKRTIEKRYPGAPHDILLVLDATTGQNALSQAVMFNEALGVTSIAITKLDGTAKGGIAACICGTLNIPIKYIGIGEGIDDLQEFNPEEFTNALF